MLVGGGTRVTFLFQPQVAAALDPSRAPLFAERLREQILQPVPHRHYTFSVPKVLRGLFERERRLLSLISQTAYESIRKSFQQILHHENVQPGVVTSLQTFGSFGSNFNPHCHGLVTEGAFTPQGEFIPLPIPATYRLADIEERAYANRNRKALSQNELTAYLPSCTETKTDRRSTTPLRAGLAGRA